MFEGSQSAVFVQTTLHYAELLLDAALKAGTVKSDAKPVVFYHEAARIAGERMGLAPFEADSRSRRRPQPRRDRRGRRVQDDREVLRAHAPAARRGAAAGGGRHERRTLYGSRDLDLDISRDLLLVLSDLDERDVAPQPLRRRVGRCPHTRA